MEQFKCLECNTEFGYRKTLGRHIRDVHKMDWLVYNEKHGQSERRTCHCGREFENRRYPGGPNRYGRKKKHCSPQCTQIATNCRFRGLDLKTYWQWQTEGCALCGQKETVPGKRMLSIDHDHETGKIRGLLCNFCNQHIVGANTIETAQKVLVYLQR